MCSGGSTNTVTKNGVQYTGKGLGWLVDFIQSTGKPTNGIAPARRSSPQTSMPGSTVSPEQAAAAASGMFNTGASTSGAGFVTRR